jgi:hypothetical protein
VAFREKVSDPPNPSLDPTRTRVWTVRDLFRICPPV